MPSFAAAEILLQLDECTKDFRFPMFDNGYYYPVDHRLHAYADDSRWALLIETLGYNPRAGNLIDVIQKFGNCIGEPGFDNDDFLPRLENADELEKIASDDKDWSRASGVIVRGTTLRIPVVVSHGTELWDLLRLIVPSDRERFLATEDELRARVPADLPLMLTLDEWNHPDVVNGQMPSRTEAFQQLAEVLVTRDTTRYAPSLEPNTHWTNWPEGGAL